MTPQVADDVALFSSMSTDERVANFGGPARIARLNALLTTATAAGVRPYIVSIGRRAAFVPHLEDVGLLGHFEVGDIYGQDSEELRRERFVKGQLIAQLMRANGWSHEQVCAPRALQRMDSDQAGSVRSGTPSPPLAAPACNRPQFLTPGALRR